MSGAVSFRSGAAKLENMTKVGGFGTVVIFVTVVACSSSGPTNSPPTEADSGATSQPTGIDAGQPPPDAAPEAAASCGGPGETCGEHEAACCNGHTCVYDVANPSKSICAANCLGNGQCNSGCCTVLIAGTSAVCAPSNYCPASCSQPGDACTATTCCPNAICVNSTVTGVTCAARCTTGTQCVSGCCAPLDNTGELVCSPASFCGR